MSALNLGRVENSMHVEWPVTGGGPHGEDRLRFEVYSGTIVMGINGGSHTHTEDFSAYLPLFEFQVRSYGKDIDTLPFTTAIMVTPVTFQAHEDEEFLCGIDSYGFRFAPQSFVGVAGTRLLPILDFKASILNGTLHRVAYHVTLSTPLDARLNIVNLDENDAPQ